MRHLGDTWTPERVALLTDCWARGLTKSQIVREFAARGIVVTANAVIGKAHRLKLKARPSPLKRPPKPIATKVVEHRLARRIDLGNHKAGGCQWIEADDAVTATRAWLAGKGPDPHCGAARIPGTAWCSAHAARVYVNPSKRPWTDEEDAELLQMRRAGMDPIEIAKALKRSLAAIDGRTQKLGRAAA